MSQHLSISRAARAVGVTRAELQSLVKKGELSSFDGMLTVEELLRVFPQASVADEGMLERVNEIKEQAFGRRIFERALPDKEVLAERLLELGKELASAKAHLNAYATVLNWLEIKLREAAEENAADRTVLESIRHWLGRALAESLANADAPSPLLVKDSLLRMLEAHVKLLPSGHEFVVEGSESILQSALRAGLTVNYGCRDGSCGKCKAKLVSGRVKQIRPFDYVLSDAEQQAGVKLMCAHTAVTDVLFDAEEARAPAEVQDQQFEARVKRLESLPGDVLLLRLHMPPCSRLRFLSGQSVVLRGGGFNGELPIATCPCEDRRLEFHVPHRQLPDSLREGVPVLVEGPHGEFILRAESGRPLLFVAHGIAFAPVKSLIEQAIALNGAGHIHLYWLAAQIDGVYLGNLCRAWSDALDNFSFTPLVNADYADSARRIVAGQPELAKWDIYLAAPPAVLDRLKQVLLEAGADAAHLYSLAYPG